MNEALKEALKAFERDEIPVGAVVVADNRVIASAHNLSETLRDATAHAEMQAITAASDYLGGKYLDECTLYVTLEPCIMCAGAAFWAQLRRIVYAAPDEKRGFRLLKQPVLHPKTMLLGGILADETIHLMKSFFNKKRIK